MAFLKLIASIVPVFLAIKKARNDYTVANKRTSAKKKAALKSSLRTAVFGGVVSLIVGVCLFGAEIFDNQRRERNEIDRHQDLRTNQLTREQVADAFRKEIRALAIQQNESRKEEFNQKYPEGYVVFSVGDTNLSKEVTLWNSNGLKFEWEKAEVSLLTSNEVQFALLGVRFSGPLLFHSERILYSLERKKGATSGEWNYNMGIDPALNQQTNVSLVVEVAESNPMGVVMVAGFQKTIRPVQPRKLPLRLQPNINLTCFLRIGLHPD